MELKVSTKKLDDLEVSASNIRKTGVNEDIELYKSSITKHGLVQPIVIDKEGKVFIGQKRLKALKELGVEDIIVVSVPKNVIIALEKDVNEDTAIVQSLIENTVRRPVSINDIKETILHLIQKYGSLRRVSEITGISEDVLRVWASFQVSEPPRRRKSETKTLLDFDNEKPENPRLKPVATQEGIVEKPSDRDVVEFATGVSSKVVSNIIIAVAVPQPIYDALNSLAEKKKCTIQELVLKAIMKIVKVR